MAAVVPLNRRAFRNEPKRWGNPFLGDLDYVGTYVPPAVTILTSNPKPGTFYHVQKGDTVWGISKNAYGRANVKAGLLTINASAWNGHIRKGSKGWEAYKVQGLQLTPHYSSSEPHAGYGSGNSYPVIWIPPLDTRAEPSSIWPPDTVTAGPPGSAGARGASGARGATGARGAAGDRGPAGAPGAIDASSVRSAVADFFKANPAAAGAPGAPGPIGPVGRPGSVGPRGAAGAPGVIDAASVRSAVDDFFRANPAAAGAPGAPGPIGPVGPGATDADLDRAIARYFAAHPVQRSTGTKEGGRGLGEMITWLTVVAGLGKVLS